MGNIENLKKLIEENKKISIDKLVAKLNIKKDICLEMLSDLCEDDESNYKWTIIDDVYYIDSKTTFFGDLRVVEKGFGFVINKSENVDDAFVPPTALNNCINNDRVIYEMKKEADGRYTALVVALVKRDKEFLVGEIQKNNGFIDFVPNENNFKNYRFRILNKNDIKLNVSDIVKAKIKRVDGRYIFVRVQKTIGSNENPADRILSIAYEFGINPDFSGATLKEAGLVAKTIDYNDREVSRRKKIIKDLNLVTIDGVDSKDLDDAIYIEKNTDGYRLLVSIADVSYYVREKSSLDDDALARGNSVYLVNRVIPMLPKVLSDGVCSLNPNEEKLCMVCDINFDKTGKILNYEIYESIMISKARLNYKQVNKYYETGSISETAETKKVLDAALELHNLIEGRKKQKGVIDFDINEPKIILDDNSKVVDIEVRERGISERLIENFMVAANETVATAIFKKDLPFIYRNHDKPKSEDIIEWASSLKMLGINATLKGDLTDIKPGSISEVLQAIDKSIDDKNEKEILNITLLHHMAKAKYELNNIGHFGLASDCYTHFTSPIRRYSDLIVHRYLKKYLIENKLESHMLKKNEDFIRKASNIINLTEKQAVDAEREVIKVCSTEYMSQFVGQTFEGNIAAVLKFGLFVQVEKCVEGLIHISNLPEFEYNDKLKIIANKNNVFFRIGQKVKVKLINADIKKRVIDFELVQ